MSCPPTSLYYSVFPQLIELLQHYSLPTFFMSIVPYNKSFNNEDGSSVRSQAISDVNFHVSEIIKGLVGLDNAGVIIDNPAGYGSAYDLNLSFQITNPNGYQTYVVTDSNNINFPIEVYVKQKSTGNIGMIRRYSWSEANKLLGTNYFDGYCTNTMYLNFIQSNKLSQNKEGSILAGVYCAAINYNSTDLLVDPQIGINKSSVKDTLSAYSDFCLGVPCFGNVMKPISYSGIAVNNAKAIYNAFVSYNNVSAVAFPTSVMTDILNKSAPGCSLRFINYTSSTATVSYTFTTGTFTAPPGESLVPFSVGSVYASQPYNTDYRMDIANIMAMFSSLASGMISVEVLSSLPVGQVEPYALVALDTTGATYTVDVKGHVSFAPNSNALMVLNSVSSYNNPHLADMMYNMLYFIRAAEIPLVYNSETLPIMTSFFNELDPSVARAAIWDTVVRVTKGVGRWIMDNRGRLANIGLALLSGNYTGALSGLTNLASSSSNGKGQIDYSVARACIKLKDISACFLKVQNSCNSSDNSGVEDHEEDELINKPQEVDLQVGRACVGCTLQDYTNVRDSTRVVNRMHGTSYKALLLSESDDQYCSDYKLREDSIPSVRSMNPYTVEIQGPLIVKTQHSDYVSLLINNKLSTKAYSRFCLITAGTPFDDYTDFLYISNFKLPFNCRENLVDLNGVSSHVRIALSKMIGDEVVVVRVNDNIFYALSEDADNVPNGFVHTQELNVLYVNWEDQTYRKPHPDDPVGMWNEMDRVPAFMYNSDLFKGLKGGSALRGGSAFSGLLNLAAELDTVVRPTVTPDYFSNMYKITQGNVYGSVPAKQSGLTFRMPASQSFYYVPVLVLDKEEKIVHSSIVRVTFSPVELNSKTPGLGKYKEIGKNEKPGYSSVKAKWGCFEFNVNDIVEGESVTSFKGVKSGFDFVWGNGIGKNSSVLPHTYVQFWVDKASALEYLIDPSWTICFWAYLIGIPSGTVLTGALQPYGAFSPLSQNIVDAKLSVYNNFAQGSFSNTPFIICYDGSEAPTTAILEFKALNRSKSLKIPGTIFDANAPYSLVICFSTSDLHFSLSNVLTNNEVSRVAINTRTTLEDYSKVVLKKDDTENWLVAKDGLKVPKGLFEMIGTSITSMYPPGRDPNSESRFVGLAIMLSGRADPRSKERLFPPSVGDVKFAEDANLNWLSLKSIPVDRTEEMRLLCSDRPFPPESKATHLKFLSIFATVAVGALKSLKMSGKLPGELAQFVKDGYFVVHDDAKYNGLGAAAIVTLAMMEPNGPFKSATSLLEIVKIIKEAISYWLAGTGFTIADFTNKVKEFKKLSAVNYKPNGKPTNSGDTPAIIEEKNKAKETPLFTIFPEAAAQTSVFKKPLQKPDLIYRNQEVEQEEEQTNVKDVLNTFS